MSLLKHAPRPTPAANIASGWAALFVVGVCGNCTFYNDPMDLVKEHPFTAPLVIELQPPENTCNAPPSSTVDGVKKRQRWGSFAMAEIASIRYQHERLSPRTKVIAESGGPMEEAALVYATVWGGETPITCGGVPISDAWVIFPTLQEDYTLESQYGITRHELRELMAENADDHGIKPATEQDLLREPCPAKGTCTIDDAMQPLDEE